MTKNNEEMPIVFKTNLERLQHKTKLRQAALRAKRHAEGYVEVSMWLKVKTLDRLQIMKEKSSLTQGQIIDQLMSTETCTNEYKFGLKGYTIGTLISTGSKG